MWKLNRPLSSPQIGDAFVEAHRPLACHVLVETSNKGDPSVDVSTFRSPSCPEVGESQLVTCFKLRLHRKLAIEFDESKVSKIPSADSEFGDSPGNTIPLSDLISYRNGGTTKTLERFVCSTDRHPEAS